MREHLSRRIHRALLILGRKFGVLMEAHFLWEADTTMLEAFMRPGPGSLASSAPPGYEEQGQQDDPSDKGMLSCER